MRKIYVSFVIGCLIMVMSGCASHGKPIASMPAIPQKQQTTTAPIITNPPSTNLQQPANQSPAYSWSPVGGTPWAQGDSTGTTLGNSVYCLVAVKGTLYAGTNEGVWSWNGSSWSLVGGSNGPSASVYDLALLNGTLYAATDGGIVWSWNGSSWSQVGGSGYRLGNAERTGSLAVLDGMLYAATPRGVYSWNGSSWSLLPDSAWSSHGLTGSASIGPDLAAINGRLYAGTYGSGVWLWDGSTWKQVDGLEGMAFGAVGCFAMYNGKLYIGTLGGGVCSWNGSTWDPAGGNNGLADDVEDVASLAVFNGRLYAGTDKGVWSWNGSSWSQLDGSGSFKGMAAGIRCLVAINSTLYAGTDGGVFRMLITQTPPTP